MTIITIKTWLDSGADHQSTYITEFEIDEASWAAMTDEQKDDYAKEYAWDRMDWGWSLKEKNTMVKPYGYVRADGKGLFIYGDHQFTNNQNHDLIPVYTHPKDWVGLTDDEQQQAYEQWQNDGWGVFYNAIEAKLKEKNT